MVAGVAAALFAVVVVVTLLHLTGGGSTCSIAPPVASLSPQLRSLGGFDQGYDPGDRQTLDTVAAQAASVVAPRLIGAQGGDPVLEQATDSARPAAVVVPLLRAGSDGSSTVVGLVSFLRDCSGRAYYAAVDDLTSRGGATAQQFPRLSEPAAAQRLGTVSPQLVYSSDPFTPLWRNPATGASVAAG